MTGFLYLAEIPSLSLLKIGFTKNPAKRMACLKSRDTPDIRMIATILCDQSCELPALKKFRAHLIRGREWFSDAVEIRQYFKPVSYSLHPDHNHHIYSRNSYYSKANQMKFRETVAATFFKNIRAARVPIYKVCERANVAPATITNWRKNKAKPNASTIGRLEDALSAIEAERKAA